GIRAISAKGTPRGPRQQHVGSDHIQAAEVALAELCDGLQDLKNLARAGCHVHAVDMFPGFTDRVARWSKGVRKDLPRWERAVHPVCPIDPSGAGPLDKAFRVLHQALVVIDDADHWRPSRDTDSARDQAEHYIRDRSRRLWDLTKKIDVEELQGDVN